MVLGVDNKPPPIILRVTTATPILDAAPSSAVQHTIAIH
ncbi:MAG: hypothetical protein ACJAY5_000724 [Actinomycetes bacterium]|jgi:hypothetical protein